MDLLKYPRKSIAYIENTNIPLLYYFLAFFSVISIRTFIELYSDNAQTAFRLFPLSHEGFFAAYASNTISFLHFYLFWITLFLIFPFLVSAVTKISIAKTLRIILGFSWIIIITPVFDLIVSKGKGIEAGFVEPQSIMSLLPLPSVNPGEKITVVVSILLIFIYVLVKISGARKAFLQALLVSFLFYIANLISFIYPFVIMGGARLFNKDFEITTPANIIQMLTAVVVVEAALLFYAHSKEYCRSIMTKIGLSHIAHLVLLFILGAVLFKTKLDGLLYNNGLFVLSCLTIVLGFCVVTLLHRADELPIPKEDIRLIVLVTSLLALFCAAMINVTTLFFLIVAISSANAYYLPPFKLMRVPIFSKLLLSFNLLLVVMLGWLFAGGELLGFPQIISAYILVFVTGCLNYIDIGATAGVKTMPDILGVKYAKWFIGFIFFLSYLLIPLLFLEKELLPPCAAFGTLMFALMIRKHFRKDLIFLTYLASLISLLVWLNFVRSTL
ncbi:UbiA family prenyltransferase [Candidatus Omnitrophota bacterium]